MPPQVPGSRFQVSGSSRFYVRVLRSNSDFRVLISDLSGGLARVKDRFDRHAEPPHEADDPARLRPDVPADAIRRLVDAVDRTADFGVEPLGPLLFLSSPHLSLRR